MATIGGGIVTFESATDFAFFWGVVIPIVITINGASIAMVILAIKGACRY